MIYVSFMDIMPMSVEFMGGAESPMAGKLGRAAAYAMFFAGVVAAAIIDYLVPEHVESDKIGGCPHCESKSKTKHAALLTAIAISAHNFPEGLSVFVTSLEDVKMGAAIAFAITLHNIPEGISVALPIYNATGDKNALSGWRRSRGSPSPPVQSQPTWFRAHTDAGGGGRGARAHSRHNGLHIA